MRRFAHSNALANWAGGRHVPVRSESERDLSCNEMPKLSTKAWLLRPRTCRAPTPQHWQDSTHNYLSSAFRTTSAYLSETKGRRVAVRPSKSLYPTRRMPCDCRAALYSGLH